MEEEQMYPGETEETFGFDPADTKLCLFEEDSPCSEGCPGKR